MRIGYPCINLSLACRASRTFRLQSYSDERMAATVANNLSCLREMLEFNVRHGLLFFRITSDLVPFASHPVCTYAWQEAFAGAFRSLGGFLREHGLRVSLHPDQFILINAKDPAIVARSVAELRYHAEILDLLETDATAKIQIHVGGLYGEKENSLARFVARYETLPETIRRRLVVENDERLFDTADCLELHAKTGIPVVFDAFHFHCLNGGESLREAFGRAHGTWKENDGALIVDYSSQKPGARKGTHAHAIDPNDFRAFLRATAGFDFDILCEIKDKEKSALVARDILAGERPQIPPNEAPARPAESLDAPARVPNGGQGYGMA